MIRTHEFRKISVEVENSIQQVFNFAKQNEKDKNDFYLFLCNATCIDDAGYPNPYVIDYMKDSYIDQHRLSFLNSYLNSYYSFRNYNTIESDESFTLEMMLYTHIWESKTFLKQLKKLLDICLESEYCWDKTVEIGTNSNFIRQQLRDNYKKKNLSIADIITNSYRSQLRNAFAHSDYSFKFNEYEIVLHNYDPKDSYTVKSISFDDWTIRFCYSFLLNYHLLKQIEIEKKNVDEEKIEVFLRNKDGVKKKGWITYHSETKGFTGK